MTVKPVLQIGNPALRRPATSVPSDNIQDANLQALITDLVDTMRSANGAGLAANQIGAPERIMVMEVLDNPRYPYKPRIPLTVAINPIIEILSPGDPGARQGNNEATFVNNEGCLSVPLRGDVERHISIRVSYQDTEGVHHVEVKHGLTAGTWQHECDHLDGVLFIDRVQDPNTLSTWDEFAANGRDAFIERITKFVARVGS